MKMIRPRWFAKMIAKLGGYFWLPCPVCAENFGGMESGRFSVWDSPGGGRCACRKPACQEIARQSRKAFGFVEN